MPDPIHPLPVALDLRHLPRESVGTRVHGAQLARALGARTDVALTLLVRDPAQAAGLPGRVLTEDRWRDDVAVLHKPAQVFDRREMALLFDGSAPVVFTYQDLIAYRAAAVFADDARHAAYRATSALCLSAAQHVIVFSENTRRDVLAEFGLSPEEVTVVPLGVDAASFAGPGPEDTRLPRRYFFALGTDLPTKNLRALREAYALLRSGWTDGEPPALVLAGHGFSGRDPYYPELRWENGRNGIVFLGAVDDRRLRALYRQALALVFPSLDEGFGLPPLEAMASGTPVIALPVSSIPEVCADAALYPEGLTARSLARAMERIARDERLREDLRGRGLKRVALFRWEETARRAVAVYRRAALTPSPRGLRTRRLLGEVIRTWAAAPPPAPVPGEGLRRTDGPARNDSPAPPPSPL